MSCLGKSEYADVIIVGKIITMRDENDIAEALAIRGDTEQTVKVSKDRHTGYAIGKSTTFRGKAYRWEVLYSLQIADKKSSIESCNCRDLFFLGQGSIICMVTPENVTFFFLKKQDSARTF